MAKSASSAKSSTTKVSGDKTKAAAPKSKAAPKAAVKPAAAKAPAKKAPAKAAAKKPAVKAAPKASAAKAPVAKAAAKPAAAKAPKKVALPEKFTNTTLISYVAEKNDLTKNQAKDIVEDILSFMESGIMKGERVPLGKIGKVFVKVKPATKARMGRNPATGETIKIAAKKATKIPKFTFSKAFKEAALKAKIKK